MKTVIRNRYNQVPYLTGKGKKTKTQENTAYTSAKRSALSQKVSTRLQGTDSTTKKTQPDVDSKR